MTDKNRDKIRAFLTELLQAKSDNAAFSDEDALFSTGRLDSLNAIKTVLFLEKEFAVDFSVTGFDQTLIDSVDAIVALVSAQ